MNEPTRSCSNTRRNTKEWAAIIAAAVLIHVCLLLFFKPAYLSFLKRELPRQEEGWGRFPYLDNPFQVIPLAPALPVSPIHPTIPFEDPEGADETAWDFDIGDLQIEVPLIRRSAGGPAIGRAGSRNATIQPKPLYIPWPKYPKGVKETAGSVELLVFVNEKGGVDEVTVAHGLPEEELNRLAVEAARRIRFTPGIERGARTSMWVRIAIGFQPR